MKGATEYADIDITGQHGRLFIKQHSHARGATLRMWVLPEGVMVEENKYPCTPPAVEVYGVTSGQPGWTETYGWLHAGPWQEDFHKIVEVARSRKARLELERRKAAESFQQKQKAADREMLESY